eukprot:g11220.t1
METSSTAGSQLIGKCGSNSLQWSSVKLEYNDSAGRNWLDAERLCAGHDNGNSGTQRSGTEFDGADDNSQCGAGLKMQEQDELLAVVGSKRSFTEAELQRSSGSGMQGEQQLAARSPTSVFPNGKEIPVSYVASLLFLHEEGAGSGGAE